MAESTSSSPGSSHPGEGSATPGEGKPAVVPSSAPGSIDLTATPTAATSVPNEPATASRPEVGVDYMPPITWKSIAAVVVILALGLGSCAGLGYWGTYELMDSEAARWVDRYKTHPQVVRRLGQIEESGFDAQSALKESNEETLTFFLQGPKGRGQLRVTEFGMQIPRVELVIKDEVIVIQRGVANKGGEHGEGGGGHGAAEEDGVAGEDAATPAAQPENGPTRE